MKLATLRDFFDARQPEILAAIQALVAQETPSQDKAALDAFAAVLAARYTDAGAAVTTVPATGAGNHLIARFPAAGDEVNAQPPALLLCHFDTVWPIGSLATHPVRVEEGRAYGPGIFDMQSSLVLCEYALRAVGALTLALPRPVTVLMTSDEEVGSHSSRELIEEEARRSAYVLVMESPLPGGVLKTARKGIGSYRLDVIGKASHAGVDPYKGVHAIEELAHQILVLHRLANREKGTTVSAGVVSGGTASNVIPAFATCKIDVRAWSQAEADRVAWGLQRLQPILPGATLRVSGGWNRPPLERTATIPLFEKAKRIGAELGLDLQEGGTGGGSDGNFTGALGIPTLDGLGVPGDGAHADHEHILVGEIAGRAALLTALLLRL